MNYLDDLVPEICIEDCSFQESAGSEVTTRKTHECLEKSAISTQGEGMTGRNISVAKRQNPSLEFLSMSKTGNEFKQIPIVPGREAPDQYLYNSRLYEPVMGEFTDYQGFQNLVESLVQIRSKAEARRKPRFSTPAALTGLENSEFDGILFSETTGPTRGCGDALESAADPRGNAGRLHSIKVVNFSENGIQIQFECTESFELFNSHLFLKIGDARIPVKFMWYRQSQPFCRGGLKFSENTDFGRKAAGMVSNMCTSLVDYLIGGFKSKAIPFSEQAGVYAYLAIFYSLRLLFLEKIAALKEFETRAVTRNMSSVPDYILAKLSGLSAERFCMVNDRLIGIFMKPYFDFGCGLPGMGEDVVFPQQDVRAAIINSMFFTEKNCLDSTDLLPAIQQFYQRFLELKLLLQGVFEAEEFDNQFRYYNRIIRGISLIT